MNLVRRSKSKGGGRDQESGISSSGPKGFFLSSSWISIAMKSSLSGPPGLRTAFWRIDVRVWAVVSAMPPRICMPCD